MSDYSKQLDAENERRINEILRDMPSFARLYFNDARRSKLSRTRLGYAQDIAAFFKWMQSSAGFSDTDLKNASPDILEKLTFEDFEEYKNSIEFSSRTDRKGNHLLTENTTVARRLSAIRSFTKFYFRIGMIKTNPSMFISMPKIADRNIIALESIDIDRLLDTLTSNQGLTPRQIARRKKTEKRDIAILMLLLGTGIRVSELVGMDLKDVDLDNGRVVVTLKGGNEGYSYIGPEVEDVLVDYIENGRPLLAPSEGENALFLSAQHKRITVRAVELLIKDYAARAGVSNAEKITPHKLRATYGTFLYEQSGDIKLVAETLHHKSVETTSKHYIKDSEERHRKVVNYSSEMFGAKGN